MSVNQQHRWFAPALAIAAGLWAIAILTAPAMARGSTVGAYASAAIYGVGALICHQRPERSFHWFGAQLPVCARCSALYLGGAMGVLAWLAWRRRLSTRAVGSTEAMRWLGVSSVPTLLTLATASVNLWDPSNVPRALATLPLGLVAGAVLAAVASKDLG